MKPKPMTIEVLNAAREGRLPGLLPIGTRVTVERSLSLPAVTGVVTRQYAGGDDRVWDREDDAYGVQVDLPLPSGFPYSDGRFAPLASRVKAAQNGGAA